MNCKHKYSIIIFIFCAFISCGDTDEYRVDPEFEVYLQRFEMLAAQKGRKLDHNREGLIIEFADLEDGKAGLAHYENPVRIEIDRNYWERIGNSAGADLMKENLIFHELGHGLLRRGHINSTLKNGDWKSIMCGGEKVGDRPWNINYRGIRRSYYIDELFNESTPAPVFADDRLAIDTSGFISSLYLSFDSAPQAGWPLVDTEKHKTSLDNGRLKFESKVKDNFLVFARTGIDIQSDFTFELVLEYPAADASGHYGLIFGYLPEGSNGSKDPIEFFTINNNKKMYMGNRSWYSFYTELAKPAIVTKGRNHLKVVKLGRMLYYFINGAYSYQSEMETIQPGSSFGFMVPSFGSLWLEDFSISRKNITKSASRVAHSNQVEFEMVSVPFEINEIKKH